MDIKMTNDPPDASNNTSKNYINIIFNFYAKYIFNNSKTARKSKL